jgi:hypothetical protein
MFDAQNVGGTDRLVRGVLGVSLVAVAVGAAVSARRGLAIVAGLAATGLLFNAVTGFCGCNALLGLDTTVDRAGDRE